MLCEHFDREITILSDGGVTTCCVDNMGLNRFANIFEDSLEEAMLEQREMKRNFVLNARKAPAVPRLPEQLAGPPLHVPGRA